MNSGVWIIRALAALLGSGILFLTLPMLLRPPVTGLPAGFHLPGIALEWVQTPGQFIEIIEKVPRPIAKIQRELKIDSYVIVPLYVALLIALGLWLRAPGSVRDTLLAGGVVVCALSAGLFDLRENNTTIAALNAHGQSRLSHSLLFRKYRAYAAKWACIALALALVALLSLLGGQVLGGVALLLAAIALGIGLAGRHSLVEWGFSLMGLGLLLSALSV